MTRRMPQRIEIGLARINVSYSGENNKVGVAGSVSVKSRSNVYANLKLTVQIRVVKLRITHWHVVAAASILNV